MNTQFTWLRVFGKLVLSGLCFMGILVTLSVAEYFREGIQHWSDCEVARDAYYDKHILIPASCRDTIGPHTDSEAFRSY
jgi:hypothetical protein